MAKYENGDTGGGESGRLGGCADLNLGTDHPSHRATGRFSNGLNIPDIINKHLGAEPTLPYLSPDLCGANFASAGVGILNDTGIQFVNIVRMSRQLQFFAESEAVRHGGEAGAGDGDGAAGVRAAELFNPQLSRALQELAGEPVPVEEHVAERRGGGEVPQERAGERIEVEAERVQRRQIVVAAEDDADAAMATADTASPRAFRQIE
uniref:Uncharacterized protein n=1 Tax=Oryza meridionalis TaxID=40149 RepID=A0A0E0C2R3_9ORYZ